MGLSEKWIFLESQVAASSPTRNEELCPGACLVLRIKATVYLASVQISGRIVQRSILKNTSSVLLALLTLAKLI